MCILFVCDDLMEKLNDENLQTPFIVFLVETGCLLSVRKRAYWEAERRENFKLSSLLETKQGKGFKSLDKRPNTRDFSKLSTEPETSEDERVDDSLVI